MPADHAFATEAQRLAAFFARETAADGAFFIGVRTTGIFCKPICPARPKPENIVFFEARTDALAAGFRPCKRCKP